MTMTQNYNQTHTKEKRITKRDRKLRWQVLEVPVIHQPVSPLDRMPATAKKSGRFKGHPVSVRRVK